ncbi:MAG: N-acetylmuramic acid 6-phosphate etherase [Marinilabiliaceae bacterium]|nr:N-acetylmuramic acid 6-phosphate etherase [Marinilabiliaceae bacterium]
MKYIGIDIGGTWIKATLVDEAYFFGSTAERKLNIQLKKIESPLHEGATTNELIDVLKKLITKFGANKENVSGVGISTGGIVDYHGSKVLKAAAHLNVLKTENWKTEIENELNCTISIINDADAATLGISELGLLKGNKTVGIMPLGTGLGFSVWRNGRRWRPGKMLNLLGSIRTPNGFYDGIASASKLALEDTENNLIEVLTQDIHKEARDEYLNNLVKIINTAAIIYNLDEVMICGGLADAANACNYPLETKLNLRLAEQQVELDKVIKASVLKEGNKLQLIGAVSLAKGEAVAKANQIRKHYKTIPTETPYQKNIQLQNLSTSEIVKLLWKAEQEAGDLLEQSFSSIEQTIDTISERITKDGRIIYVGAGTSGRIAAMDAVEIPCTYGFPEDRILCQIAGGIADSAIEIESDFEEDASSVPEMLLMNITENDSVIGISASGTAYYVQSALAFAKERGAYSVMIQSEEPKTTLPFCNNVIPLNSGYEVVAGSTRMKAGTATKKILNFISSSVMIKMGKVAGSYMIDVACINNKLIDRAQSILGILYDMDKNEALTQLKNADWDLSEVIKNIQSK